MAPILAYWRIRGLAQPLRLYLNYHGIEFEEKFYELGDGPEFSLAHWTDDKNSLGLDFPNLPYYIDGDVRITQSNCIFRYLARKHGLDVTTEKERILVDLLAEEVMDLRNGLVRLCYNPNFYSLLPNYKKMVAGKFKLFEAFLGDKPWLVGEKILFMDFILYEMLDQHKIMIPNCLDDTPKLQAFCERFESLPAIKAYMKSDKFMKAPLNSMAATFVQ